MNIKRFHHLKINQKKATVAMLILDKRDSRTRKVIREKGRVVLYNDKWSKSPRRHTKP